MAVAINISKLSLDFATQTRQTCPPRRAHGLELADDFNFPTNALQRVEFLDLIQTLQAVVTTLPATKHTSIPLAGHDED